MHAIRKPIGLLSATVLSLVGSAVLVSCQDRSPSAWHYEISPASTAGGGTNSQQTFSPSPSNSVAFRETKARAEKGEAAAQTKLGQMYEYGYDVPQDQAEAVKWYRKAVERGDGGAQWALGGMYALGEGVDKDQAEAVKWYREAAEQYRKAAEQGDPHAQFSLSFCYRDGKGVQQDYSESVKWDHKAAEQGSADAHCDLGTRYQFGWWGVPQDYAQAAMWYRKAAEQDDSVAQLALALMCFGGTGVPQDYVEAYKWLNLGTASVTTEADHTMADQLMSSLRGVMTSTQIEEGQRLSREFRARKAGEAPNRNDGQDSSVVGNVPRFTGTGFFVTDDGYLLTAFHVVADAARIAVRTSAGTFAATLVNADKANDLALLKVNGKFPTLPVASSRWVKLGESVFTIGFPNIELQGFAPKLTKGDISSLTGMQDDPREFQISVAVQPGNSGGPLVNQYGNVVGIVEARLADVSTLETTGALPQNVNYALKSSALNVLLENLPEISAKLPEANPTKDRKFDDVEKEAESAVALVLVY